MREPHERARTGPCGVVFRQVTAGLTHQPDRRVWYGLAQQGAQEHIVLQRGNRHDYPW
ncbi:Uncharacterised protein [Bordetella pertussis]|nr:Uncharacterised protein [Bordetella pertussis]